MGSHARVNMGELLLAKPASFPRVSFIGAPQAPRCSPATLAISSKERSRAECS